MSAWDSLTQKSKKIKSVQGPPECNFSEGWRYIGCVDIIRIMCLKASENPIGSCMRFYLIIFFRVLVSSFLKTKQGFTCLNLLLTVLPYFVAVFWFKLCFTYRYLDALLLLHLLTIASLLDGIPLPSPAFPSAGRAEKVTQGLFAYCRAKPAVHIDLNPPCWQFNQSCLTFSLKKMRSAHCAGGDFEGENCWLTGIN